MFEGSVQSQLFFGGRYGVGWWDKIVDAFTGGSGGERSGTERAGERHAADASAYGAVATAVSPEQASAEGVEDGRERWWAPDGVTRTEPIEPERPDLPHDARAFENLLISNFDGHNLNMPPMPRALERVLAMLRDRKCNFDAVAQVIGEDQVIAAAVLRMTNSPLYRGLEKITALKPAITRLGSRALQTLMMHQALRSSTLTAKGGDPELSELVWRNSLAAAYIMRGLGTVMGADPEDAFLVGLLHDIGNVIVLRMAQDEMAAGRYRIDFKTFDHLCHECHQEFGELVAEEWKLPDRLESLIANHHVYPADDDPLRIERLQLQMSDMINSMIGYGSPASYDLLSTPQARDLNLHERDDFVSFLADLPVQLAR